LGLLLKTSKTGGGNLRSYPIFEKVRHLVPVNEKRRISVWRKAALEQANGSVFLGSELAPIYFSLAVE
jgi:hypothetical protein